MSRFYLLMPALCCMFLQSRAQSADSLFLHAAITKLVHSKEYTLEVARLMPAENYGFKPVREEMTFGRQLLHLSQNLGWLASSYLKDGEKNPVRDSEMRLQKKDSIIEVVTRAYDYALEALENFPPADLKDEVTFFAGPMNKLQIINLVNDHQTHHRGQLLVYLRLKGIKPPAYVGW